MAAENQTIMNSTMLSVDEEWTPPPFAVTPSNIVVAIVLTALDTVTFFGNLIVLIAFLVDNKLRQPFNLFIMNLAVTDICVGITAMPFYTIDTLLGYWPFGQAMCGVWIYFDFAMTFASVFTMVAISIDRFWCVTWAIHYKTHNNITKTIIFLVVVWVCVFAIWTPPFIADRLANEEVHYCIWEPNENRQFVLFVAVIGHYVPCIIMVSCYIKVFVVMRRQKSRIAASTANSVANSAANSTTLPRFSGRHGNEQSQSKTNSSHDSEGYMPKSGNQLGIGDGGDLPEKDRQHLLQVSTVSAQSGQLEKNGTTDSRLSPSPLPQPASSTSRDKKIFITLTYVIGSYLICWFPFYICFDTYAWAPELVPGGLYSFFFWMTYVNSTLNPFIYAYTSKDFRTAFGRVFRCLYSCKVK